MGKKPKKQFGVGPSVQPKDFLDQIAPAAARFDVDHFIMGGAFRCAVAIRGYPTSTEELALLRGLGEKRGVTLVIYARRVTPSEERQIIQNAASRSRLERSSTNDLQQYVTAEANLRDVTALVEEMNRSSEPLLHCAVYLSIAAPDERGMRALRDEVLARLVSAKLAADPLLLRQLDGFRAANPAGSDHTFASKYERVLPASSVADLYPFNFSGKTDPHGFYIGRAKYGSNIIVDLERRAEDKTTGSALILGSSGQGKSYLLKLLLCNALESGKSVLCLDTEDELRELCENLGGCYVDMADSSIHLNLLEPRIWDTRAENDPEAPAAFRQQTRLSQHISFLRDLFRSYKDFTTAQIDVIEIMLVKLYARWRIRDSTDFDRLEPTDYPILSDLYAIMEEAYQGYDREEHPLYPAELLREVMLGLNSMCVGAESRFFNGHTNVTSQRFLVFGVKELIRSGGSVKNAQLFNLFAFFSDQLLTKGNTVAVLDELHVWLSNLTAIEYIRNVLKRARKRDSSLLLASQNLEDFTVPGVAELTRPLFAIPTHQFLFHAGAIDWHFFAENLQLERSEYELIRFAQRGTCLYKCGNERFLLEVKAPPHKEALFGTAGGK